MRDLRSNLPSPLARPLSPGRELRSSARLGGTIACVALFGAACGPSAHLTAGAAAICSGRDVKLSWHGVGDRFLLERAPWSVATVEKSEEVSAVADRIEQLTSSTQFRLVAFKNGEQKPTDWIPVGVASRDQPISIGIQMSACRDNVAVYQHPDPLATAELQALAKGRFPGLTVGTLRVDGTPTATVDHEGGTATVTPTASAALADQLVNGTWTVRVSQPCEQAPQKVTLLIAPAQCQ